MAQVTNPQGPPQDGPSIWSRSGTGGATPAGGWDAHAQPPTPSEPPTRRLWSGGPEGGTAYDTPSTDQPPTAHPQQAQPQSQETGAYQQRANYQAAPGTPAHPMNAPATSMPKDKTAPVITKRRRFFGDPLSMVLILIIVVALLVAGLIGAELYARHVANSKVAAAVECELKDQASVHFGVAPLLLWQTLTDHFTNISVQTAGNQIRDAKGMKLDLDIQNVLLKDTADSKGTVGAIDGNLTWTSDGIRQSIQNSIPVLGPFVTNSVVTHPKDGTIELKGFLDNITAKPQVSGGGITLKIVTFNALGFTMPKESVQAALDKFTADLTKNYPLGIHVDNVEVTSTGVAAYFSTRNASIPTGNSGQDLCFANL